MATEPLWAFLDSKVCMYETCSWAFKGSSSVVNATPPLLEEYSFEPLYTANPDLGP